MSKNDKTLSVTDIENRKKELQADLEKISSQLQNLEKMMRQFNNQAKAINGAIQQCDDFLSRLEANPASSIPSQDDNASVKAAFS